MSNVINSEEEVVKKQWGSMVDGRWIDVMCYFNNHCYGNYYIYGTEAPARRHK